MDTKECIGCGTICKISEMTPQTDYKDIKKHSYCGLPCLLNNQNTRFYCEVWGPKEFSRDFTIGLVACEENMSVHKVLKCILVEHRSQSIDFLKVFEQKSGKRRFISHMHFIRNYCKHEQIR
jgi:hypothetical protein